MRARCQPEQESIPIRPIRPIGNHCPEATHDGTRLFGYPLAKVAEYNPNLSVFPASLFLPQRLRVSARIFPASHLSFGTFPVDLQSDFLVRRT